MSSIVRVEWVRVSDVDYSAVIREYGTAQELTVTGSTIVSAVAPVFAVVNDGFVRITVLQGQVYANIGENVPGTITLANSLRVQTGEHILVECAPSWNVSFVEATAYSSGSGSSSTVTGSVTVNTASTDGSGSITTANAAQVLFGGATPVNGWKVCTPGASNIYVSDSTTTPSSTTAGSYVVFANGGQYSTEVGQKPIGPVYVTCATAGQVFSAQKW